MAELLASACRFVEFRNQAESALQDVVIRSRRLAGDNALTDEGATRTAIARSLRSLPGGALRIPVKP